MTDAATPCFRVPKSRVAHHHADRASPRFFAKISESPVSNSPVIPDGWVLVPKEPTPEMREAYHQAQEECEDGGRLWSPDHQWKAMIAAAPQQEAK